ncbi:MoaD/ThiS family protein [Alloalcanivorax mobilis]|uniref:MoaD/ThiS family protein n=1 Tax=Alloalcanivorax mobilis TaxID=2019569 RepID=UPI000B5B25CF|nr:MoaD/ThiS family protein [Alloalcanivorax mobilis]ASK34244.1 molybdopterin synthase sulfur carrier subunit [Alcanivorax sp. N3-2A]|tara:strand:+ start:38214 stop:38492 length:279 start_codon:yes stop_codon:yes gene_type:complete
MSAAPAATVEVRFFAALRERAGVDRLTVTPPAPALVSVAALCDWLAGQTPQLGRALGDTPRRMVAINEVLATMDSALRDGDVVALFPPVTGG